MLRNSQTLLRCAEHRYDVAHSCILKTFLEDPHWSKVFVGIFQKLALVEVESVYCSSRYGLPVL